ncbi:tyrosine-type recombinase/integrase (plasmid) [Borrelia miyamotoi]|uniref:Tyrosine-type recombinase/integrase n=3 Tax=Borrelia miyamotoi TaxID=47466 RepID=A0ABY7VMM4_9SPIR|nr:tyrosine-type recombinase/integrase [Borrelia miyamotoi]WAZ71256.1 tyrosine-type recombinase/integrase [Borrelia miyamotoi]WCB91205.1 tyrosine-type recombinase/integrase [Borrelia miyamotoi]WCL22301.1 tyrosine-type recombinase/integrase [Borrelia miyamotoi]WDE71685.1 tyrosine-type recombinase/integrase [Borrelia miyamotoi]WDS49365.1 tyrosine-type recombinase/integrase [Borrelia miyamotoi]
MNKEDYLKKEINRLTKQNELLIKESQSYKQELEQLKGKLDKKDTKPSKAKPVRFYLNDKTIRLVKRCIDKFKNIDPIAGWFVYILSITGCRGVELQNVKLTDISREIGSDGEVFYSLRVNVAKKRSNICIREVVISKSEFDSIMSVHKHYFDAKGKDSRRTYLFQKSKVKFKNNKINISEIGARFKELLKSYGFKERKSLHLCRNIFIATLKSRGYNSFEIKELMKYSSTSEIDNVYGLSSASKIQAYKDIKNSLK